MSTKHSKFIPLFKVFMSKAVDGPLLKTLHSGWIGQCSKVDEFEEALSKKLNNPNCLTLAAGTHGLHLALRLLDIGPGDEVISTPLTCFATNVPVLYTGADIVWADVQKHSINIDPDSVRERITKKTKAIICVHWGGYPSDLKELHEIAVQHNIAVIEDAAHAYGSTYRDSVIGDCKYSDFAMISFQAIKTLTTVDGGLLTTRSRDHYKRGKLLRWYGMDREGPRKEMRCIDDVPDYGYKYHMNDVCATIGLVNMREVEKNIKIAQSNAEYYKKALKDVDGITLIQTSTDRTSSCWLFTMLVEDRDNFCRLMGEKGIHVSRVHERNDKYSCVSQFRRNDLHNLEEVMPKYICIPVGWWVTKEDREYIVDSIKQGW